MPVRISKNRVALENIPLNEALGANIASAATVNLTNATGNTVHLTGATAITAVTLGAGMVRDVIFDGVLTLTHHSTNNNLPGGVNITTALNDRARYIADGTTVYCVNYQKADGTAVVAPIGLSSKLVSASRDVSLSGTQTITGAGFKPTAAIFFTTVPYASGKVSWGMVDSAMTSQHVLDNNTDIASTYDVNNNVVSIQNSNYLNRASAVVTSWDTDGCTLTWTKVGSPTGTAIMTILFLK